MFKSLSVLLLVVGIASTQAVPSQADTTRDEKPPAEIRAEETKQATKPAETVSAQPKESVSEKPVAEKPATEKPATEKPAAERPATEKPATEKPATEKPATEKPATEKPATEKPATERPAAEKPVTEKPTTEKSTTEKPTPEKPVAQKAVAEKPVADVPQTVQPAGPKKLRFNFHFQPWSETLRWFAEEAGYSLVLDTPPTGTFNYTDNRVYTPAEALDLLNSVLLTKGYTLVLRDRMLMVVNLEDEIPPALITRIPLEELDKHGKYELLSTRFQLNSLSAEQAQAEIKDLLGPQGKIVALPQSRQLIVTETGGKLQEIRSVLEQAEATGDPSKQDLKWFELTSVSPDEALALLRQIFEIPEGGNATADGSLRFATDPIGLRLLVSGSPERLTQVSKMLKTIDQSAFGQPAQAGKEAALQIEVYDIAPADPESVLKVMQTLLSENPGVRLATDPKTGYLIALARPSEHATIKATIDQMREDAQSVDVIQLSVLDPQLAVLAITKLFGADPQKAPSVDADLANRQLLIRGSVGQIAEVRSLLEKMGETFGNRSSISKDKLRLLSVDGRNSRELIERIKELWPALGSNELRLLPARDRGMRDLQPGMIDQRTPVPSSSPKVEPPAFPGSQPEDKKESKPIKTLYNKKPFVRLVAAQVDDADGKQQTPSGQESSKPPTEKSIPNNSSPDKSKKPPIFLFSGPDGLYVSSEDTEALNKLQQLIDALQGNSASVSGAPKLTVFYLRNAQAKQVAERLKEIMAGAASSSAVPTTPAAAGGKSASPTGILGSIGVAGSIGHITPSGPVSITPDERLNALLVQAAPDDVDMIESILKILDRPGSPEDVPAEPRPRLIPIINTAASDIAEIVKEVYKDRFSSGNSRATSPAEQMMMMFRSRRSRSSSSDGPGSNQSSDSAAKISIGVDSRTNSLIVLAPEPLFEEIRELVNSLDRMSAEESEIVEVVRLGNSNPTAVQDTLSRLLGDSVESETSTGSSRRSSDRSYDRSYRGSMWGFMRGGGPPMGFSRSPVESGGPPMGFSRSRGDSSSSRSRGDSGSSRSRESRSGRSGR
ncbi:MAG: hypothetical protein JXM70_06215 [Pirellulales bacterium]|nr:hypothetical protein [Pirellulales bacterium]